MLMKRTLVWWSTGAASAVAAWIAVDDCYLSPTVIVRCETNNEDPDNYRFEADVMRFLQRDQVILKSEEFEDVWSVFETEKYMAGVDGAPCTREMKVKPRLAYQRPTDVHVFGYTADARDVERFARLKANFPELTVRAPLIERGINKAATLAIVENWGIALPRSYPMGFPNANCLGTGCVKATSPNYWSLYRLHFPERFNRTAAFARKIGARLTRIDGERRFIDEIPADWPVTQPIAPACDFLCHIVESEMSA
jgi:hypothetical protein